MQHEWMIVIETKGMVKLGTLIKSSLLSKNSPNALFKTNFWVADFISGTLS
jgi:hypothetical protein